MKFRGRCLALLCVFALVQLGCTWGKNIDRNQALALQTKVENLIEKILHVIQDYYHQIKTELKCIPDDVPDSIMETLKNSIDCVDKNERNFEGGDITSNAYKKSFLKCFSDAKKEVEHTIKSINPELDYCPENMTEKTYQINVTTTFTKTFHINIKNGLEIIRKKVQLGNKKHICVFNEGDETPEETSTNDWSEEIPESSNEGSTDDALWGNVGGSNHFNDKNKGKNHWTTTENTNDYNDFEVNYTPGSEMYSHGKPLDHNGHDNHKEKGHHGKENSPESTVHTGQNKGSKPHRGKHISGGSNHPIEPENTASKETDHNVWKPHHGKWTRPKNHRPLTHPEHFINNHKVLEVPDTILTSGNNDTISEPEKPAKITGKDTKSTTKRPQPVQEDDVEDDSDEGGDENIFPGTTSGVKTTQKGVESPMKPTSEYPIHADSESDDSEQDEEFIHMDGKERVSDQEPESTKATELKPIAKEKLKIQIKPRNTFKVKRRKLLNERHPIRLPKASLRSLKMDPVPIPQRVSSETLSLESDC